MDGQRVLDRHVEIKRIVNLTGRKRPKGIKSNRTPKWKNIIVAILEVFGIVYLRFRLVPRLWCVWLVGVNAACLFFIGHIEAQVVLIITAIAVVLHGAIYQRLQFTRILGIVHVLWIPMFAWMATRIDSIQMEPTLADWIIVLAVTNVISLIVDLVEAARFD